LALPVWLAEPATKFVGQTASAIRFWPAGSIPDSDLLRAWFRYERSQHRFVMLTTLRVGEGAPRSPRYPTGDHLHQFRSVLGPLKANALLSPTAAHEAVKQGAFPISWADDCPYLTISWKPSRRMGDVLGALNVDVPKRMYLHVEQQPGPLTIDLPTRTANAQKSDLEGFLRWRYSGMRTATSARIDRQKLCLLAALFLQNHSVRESGSASQPASRPAGDDVNKTDSRPDARTVA